MSVLEKAALILAGTLISGAVGLAAEITLTDQARRLTADSLVVDGHNDLPWALRQAGDSQVTRYNLRTVQTQFHTDIPRLREGGVGAQFWSVYVPASTSDNGAYATTLEQIEVVNRLVRKYPDVFAIALSTADITRIRSEGKIASLIGVEGGHSIESSLEKLRELYNRGARYMTLTHSRTLSWADSATDDARNNGLTAFGRQVVTEMNDLGMLVDISHVSPKVMIDALAVSRSPVIASHSSAFGVTPHPRNIPDDLLRQVAANGGVVMVNFYSAYIAHQAPEFYQAAARHAGCNHDLAAPEFLERGDVDTLVDHIDYIVRIAGIDHVGLGSDFDGVPTLPRQLDDVSKYPYLTQALLNRGYSQVDIKKILGENLMRAFKAAEANRR